MKQATKKASGKKGAGELKPQGPRGVAYDRPTKIAARHAKRFLWGDDQAGWVSDWIYGSSPKIHMMSFSMNIGQMFGNSPDFKTYYNCAETYYCLKGEFTFHCPETGEVHVLRRGDMLYFPPNTWHWGYNFGTEECRILESLTPRLEDHIEAYAAKQPMLKEMRGIERGLIGGFVPRNYKSKARATLIRRGDYAFEVIGTKQPMRVGIGVSTKLLTTCIADMYPGQKAEPVSHPGDKVLYVLEGQLNIHIPGGEGEWWELTEGDTAFIPGGCSHAYFNTSDARCEFLFSVAPDYR
ncbi:MAG: cupin domain-containing protein [Dongiaceae bacterium]